MRFYREERITVFGPDDVTPLTPRAGAAHSEPFQVTTETGVTGWKPIMQRCAHEAQTSIDRLSGGFEVGDELYRLDDKKVGTDNAVRWLTAFLGDARGRSQLKDAKIVREERLTIDGVTGSWTVVFTGRVGEHSAPEPSQHGPIMTILAKSEMAAIRRLVFVGTPHHSVTYAHAPLWPIGPQQPWNGLPVTAPVLGTIVTAGGRSLVRVKEASVPRSAHTAKMRLTEVLARAADFRLSRDGREYCPNARVRIKVISTGQSGEFWLSPSRPPAPFFAWAGTSSQSRVTLEPYDGTDPASPLWVHRGKDGNDRNTVMAAGLVPLPTTHPRYMALPADGTQVEWTMVHAGPPSANAPLLVGPVALGTLVSDVAAGKFSLLNDSGRADDPNDGAVAVAPMPVNAASMEALPADMIVTLSVEKRWKLGELLQSLTQQTHVHFIDRGDGELRAVDTRPLWTAEQLAAIPTLGNGIVLSGDWVHGQDTLGSVRITSYEDWQRGGEHLEDAEIMSVPVSGIASRATPQVYMLRRGARDESVAQIDAWGVRFSPYEPEAPRDWRVRQIVEWYRQLFEDGAQYLDVETVYRNEVKTCHPGDWRKVDVNSVPNLASNQRGGVRIMLCVRRQRTEKGFRFRFLDGGPDSIPVAPSVSEYALDSADSKRAARAVVTLASGMPAIVEVAITATSVSVRPTTGWRPVAYLEESGEVVIHPLEPGKRVWLRVYTPGVPPSPFAYPSTPYVDMDVDGAAIKSFTLSLTDDGGVEAVVAYSSDTAVVRLYHAAHDAADEPDLSEDFVTVTAHDTAYTFTGDELGGEVLTVEAEPRTAGGAVGERVRRSVVLPAPQLPGIEWHRARRLTTGPSAGSVEVSGRGTVSTAKLQLFVKAAPADAWVAADELEDREGAFLPQPMAGAEFFYRIIPLDERGLPGTAVEGVFRDDVARAMVSATFSGSNECVVTVSGLPFDTDHFITVAANSDPAAPTSAVYDATIAARDGTVATGVYVPQAADAHIAVVSRRAGGALTDPVRIRVRNIAGGTITASIAFNSANEAVVTANGPAGTAKLYITAAADAAPADPTPSEHDAQIVGMSGTVNTEVVVPEGSIAYVRIVAEDGDENLSEVVAFSRSNDAAKAAPVAYVRISALTPTQATVEYAGSTGVEGRSIATEYRRRIDVVDRTGVVIPGTVSAWSATLPDTEVITRRVGRSLNIVVWVRDAEGRESSSATVVVQPADDSLLALNDWRELESAESTRWEWSPGALVHEVWVYWSEYPDNAVPANPWPKQQENRSPNLYLPAGTTFFERAKPNEGRVVYLQFEPRDNDFPPRAGGVRKGTSKGLSPSIPTVHHIGQVPATNGSAVHTNVTAVVGDRQNRTLRVRAWLNRTGTAAPDPNGPADGYIDVTPAGGAIALNESHVWTLTGGGTANLFRNLPVHAQHGKRIYLRPELLDGSLVGDQADTLLASWYELIDPSGNWTPNIVSTQAIADAAVASAKLAENAVTTAKLADIAVTMQKVADNAITTAKLADGAITEVKITDNAISAPKIQANAVVAGKIAANAVTATTIAAGAVTTAKLDALAVTADKIAANAVTTAKLAAFAVEAGNIAAGAVTTAKLAALAVDADKIAANAITSAKIAAGAVTAGKISVASLSEIQTGMGVIVSGVLHNGTNGIRIASTDNGPTFYGWTNYLDLAATGTASVVKTQYINFRANGSAALGNHLTVDTSGNTIITGGLSAATGSFAGTLSAGVIIAGSISMGASGEIVSGVLRNSGNTVGVNLNATGSTSVFYAPNIAIRANGSMSLGSHLTVDTSGNATFSGTVSASAVVAASSFTAATATLNGVLIQGSCTVRSALQVWNGFSPHAVELTPTGGVIANDISAQSLAVGSMQLGGKVVFVQTINIGGTNYRVLTEI